MCLCIAKVTNRNIHHLVYRLAKTPKQMDQHLANQMMLYFPQPIPSNLQEEEIQYEILPLHSDESFA